MYLGKCIWTWEFSHKYTFWRYTFGILLFLKDYLKVNDILFWYIQLIDFNIKRNTTWIPRFFVATLLDIEAFTKLSTRVMVFHSRNKWHKGDRRPHARIPQLAKNEEKNTYLLWEKMCACHNNSIIFFQILWKF